MKPRAHVMILASAGSGKTYALTSRFVELLARGAAPERIVALTFTRKAAGEFFDEILHKLARAAREADFARKLSAELGVGGRCGPAEYRAMLRAVVDAMPRLRLGTLDSFFARIVRAFPFELGLAGDFELLEEHGARLERQRVLRRMFARPSAAGELGEAQKEFIEAFKRATFGADEKQLGPKLEAFLDAHQETFLEAPARARWGNPALIWPEGNPWLEAAVDCTAARAALARWVEAADIADKQRDRWRAFLAAVDEWTPGTTPSRELAYVLEKALAAAPDLFAGQAVLAFDRREQELSAEACAALADLTRHIMGGEIARRLEITRGIHAVLQSYETYYHDAVRRAGKLTFADVQRLLEPVTLTSEGPAVAEREAGGPAGQLAFDFDPRPRNDEARLFLDYRLDAEIDHWLLDEFQDTSRGQWSVLRNLVDEVVQDPTGTRSFFCVGDVKQAIYTWREGDPRLFREIFEHYNAGVAAIETRHLVDSWRSGPAVIELVNSVFGDAGAIGGLFPGDGSERWNREWRAHRTAVPARRGQAAVLLAADAAQRWRQVVELLHALRPLERGLSCAVLVPKNATATELAEFLRREAGVPALAESDLHVCTDHPLGAALLALAQAAAHPGDSLAWEHVQMTPLRDVLRAAGIATREDATQRLLGQFHAEGFERTMEHWLRALEAHFAPADAFSRTRARQFAAAAARYDATGSRDVAEFVAFMERHVVREPETAEVVRVMTIHKAKGLGFDVVILPDLQGNRIDERRGGLAVQKGRERSVEWVLELPPKIVCHADPVLSAHLRAAEAEACYESLSLLYVAFTRAKRAVYAIVEPAGESTSRNYPRLLTAALGDFRREVSVGGAKFPALWASGEGGWAETVAAPAVEPRRDEPIPVLAAPAAVPRRTARRPSLEAMGRVYAPDVFALERAAVERGAEVHALLAEVEWGDGDAAARLEARWRRSGMPADAVEEALGCLRAPALAAVWRSGVGRELWRERAFECLLDDAWVSGVFDRVIVERDAAGRRVSATVYDFKTDAVDRAASLAGAAERHAPQLDVYRRVAAVLTGLPVAAIAAEIVFTRVGSRVPVLPRATGDDRDERGA